MIVTHGLIETGYWQFCMFDSSCTTPHIFYPMGKIFWSVWSMVSLVTVVCLVSLEGLVNPGLVTPAGLVTLAGLANPADQPEGSRHPG